jgi:Holliday junction resolvase-like predicted endonuclease
MNSTAHVGAAGELFACNYFLSQGLEVCRNVAASGPVDIMVFNKENGKSAAIDVKSIRTLYTRVDGSLILNHRTELRLDGVWQIVWVHGEASPRLPEGFWESLGMDTPNYL